MRTLIILGLFMALSTSKAQTTVKTVTISVDGDCEECKEAIENAADIKGVKICTWNLDTRKAVVTFDESKTSLEKIEKAIAEKGYDTEHFKGNDAAYNKLPKCCRYRGDNKAIHGK